jgi:integrase
MPRIVLTDNKVRALRPAKAGRRYDVLDALMPGLLLRVTDKGSKSFMFRARFPGAPANRSGRTNPARRLLGAVGAMSVDQARDKARQWHALIARGIDPAWQEEQDRLGALRTQQNTFLTVAEAYFAYIQREGWRKARVIEREIRNEFVARWAARPIADITQHDLAAVIEAAVKRGSPAQAHTLFERARSLWGWAIGCGAYGLEASPTDRLRPKNLIGAKVVRNRALSGDEIQALWQAIEQEDYPWQPLYKWLLLTGCRLTEATDATWAEIDLRANTWTVAPERYKTGAVHVVPLPSDLLALIETLPRFNSGDFLFSVDWGKHPVRGLSKPKQRLDARMEAALGTLPAWRVHDIRRSVRTQLSALPMEQHVRELVIGHAKPGLHKVYDQYAYLDEKRRALELWATRLRAIVNPPPDDDKVVALRGGVA